MDPESRERREWVIPKRRGRVTDIDLSLLDPDDEDDRYFFILAEHPELVSALENEVDEMEQHGAVVNPRLHLSIHQIVANQLWQNDPPEAWATAKRMVSLGYERHEILHMLGASISDELWITMRENQPYDRTRHVAALEALPESWERMRREGS